jgi:tight adherence protein B
MVSGQAWPVLTGVLMGAAATLIPPSGADRWRVVRSAHPRTAPTAGPTTHRASVDRSGGRRRRTAVPGQAELALVADQLAALARSGLPPNRVWPILADRAATGPTRAMADAVVSGHRRGESTAQAIRGSASGSGSRGSAGSERSDASRGPARAAGHTGWWRRHRPPDPAAARLAVAIDVSERSGAALAETLQRFADGVRADLRAEQERESALAGPRTTAMILSALPLAGLGLGGLIGSHPWQTLLLTAPGRVCLLAGSAAWLSGRAWSSALIRRATPRS